MTELERSNCESILETMVNNPTPELSDKVENAENREQLGKFEKPCPKGPEETHLEEQDADIEQRESWICEEALGFSTHLKDKDLNHSAANPMLMMKSAHAKLRLPTGPSLEETLKNCRKRLFNIEQVKAEESVLNLYKPAHIERHPESSFKAFEQSFEDCLKLGKRRMTLLEAEKSNKKCALQENLHPLYMGRKDPNSTPFKQDDQLSLLMSKSIKKMSRLEQEKADPSIKNFYTPVKASHESQIEPLKEGPETLEDLLRNSKKKVYKIEAEKVSASAAKGKESCQGKMDLENTQKTTRGIF